MVCIGYLGCEAFDIILYTGRTLTKLNYRVLIIDLSDSGALKKAVHHGMELDSSHDIVNYRDINYIRKIPTSEELNAFRDAVVFVVYGMNYVKDFPIDCQQLNVVVNTFPHVIDEVNERMKEVVLREVKFNLLVRDAVTIDDVETVNMAIELTADFNRVNYLYLDISDYESAVECQLSQVIRFTKISSKMKKYIMEQIRDIFPQLKASKIGIAMKATKRGA